jgi:hypothetical protein
MGYDMVLAGRYIAGTSKFRTKKRIKVLVTSDNMVTYGHKKRHSSDGTMSFLLHKNYLAMTRLITSRKIEVMRRLVRLQQK